MTQIARLFATAALCAAVAFLFGCGGPSMGQVSGNVTVQGKPLKEGIIIFAPKVGPAGSGKVQDGQIVDVISGDRSGVWVGPCIVTITSTEPGKNPNDPRIPAIDPKYFTMKTSGLNTEIKSGSNEVKFDLQPYVPPPPPPKTKPGQPPKIIVPPKR